MSERMKKVKNLFLDALEIEGPHREKFLRENCGEPEIKMEVEKLLEAHFEAQDFIEKPVVKIGSLFNSNGDQEILKHFGNYKIIREIGAGGMGAVFLAERDDGEFTQKVAIKIVRQTIAEREIINRFRLERQILANLNHPNIARLVDGGVSNSGEPFLAMEYIEGVPITQFADEHNLNVEERLRLFLKVCAAVSYAHRNLTIHRDIKPSNILVTKDGEPKLLDFGLAKLLGEGLNFDPIQTQTVFHAFTPVYASPEQILRKNISTATDVYSLGVVLFELLTGGHPFHFENKKLQEILQIIDTANPSRPSDAVTRGHGGAERKNTSAQNISTSPRLHVSPSQLKGDLDNIILKALGKEAERRYKSVEQFAQDIERHLQGLPILARPQTFGYRASKFIQRNKIAVAAAALIFLTFLGGIIATLWQSSIARQERDNARLEKTKAQAVSKFLTGMLNYADPEANLKREMTVREILDNAASQLENENFSAQPEVKAELHSIIGYSYASQGFYELAEMHVRASLEERIKLYGENSLEVIKTKVLLADVLGQRAKLAECEQVFREILPVLRTEYQKGNIEADYLADTLHNFGVTRRAKGNSAEAEGILREAFTLLPAISEDSKDLVPLIRATLALTLFDQGKLEEAIAIARENVNYLRQTTEANTTGFGYALTTLGSYTSEKGNYAEAEAILSEAEAIYRKLLGDSHLWLGDNLRLQANTFYQQNKLEQAQSKVKETLRIYRTNTSAQYINYPTALTIEGLILNKMGKSVEAEKALREAVKIREANLPKEHFLTALAKSALGECLTTQKRFEEAEPLLLESYENLKNSQGSDNPRTKTARLRVIKFYESSDKPDLAGKFRNNF